MASFIPDEKLAEYAISEARLTRESPIAESVSAATVIPCRELMKETTWEAARTEESGKCFKG
jgi:hypothetical protein